MAPHIIEPWVNPGIDEAALHLYRPTGEATGVVGFESVGDDEIARFDEQGHLVVAGAFTADDVAAALKHQLGIDVEVSNKDRPLFRGSLTAEPTGMLFGYVSYGMDFLDPFTLLGVWLTSRRHSWSNSDFDAKVNEAASFLGPAEERLAMFQEAERMLVEDVPAVFVYYETPVQLVKPWLKGDALQPDENGNASLHSPRYTTMSTVPAGLYIGNDAPEGRAD